MRLLRSALVAVLALALLPFAAGAQTLPAGVTRGPSMGGITEYNLANGMKILLLPDASQDTITVNVTYLVGSRHESYGERGMAHLLEHLLFKGTPKIPNPKAELLKRGARYNGTTSFDRTNYFETFPASDETLAFVLGLEADRMVNARVSKADLDSEMTVVRNEFEAGQNSPFGLLRERTSAAAYLWHNYGRSVIGTLSDIENVPIERLQAFYRHYYQPDNAVLIVAGKFDADKALAAVAQTFGAIPKPARRLQTTYTVEPPQDGERSVVLRRVGEVQLAHAMYHMPPGSHPDFVAVDVLTQILTAQPSGRLHKALVETGKAASIFGAERQTREPGSAYFGAAVRKDAPMEPARDALLGVLEGFAANPVTDEEVERARTKLKGDVEQLLTNSRSVALTLSEFVAIGDWRLLYLYRNQLNKVKREDVQRVATTYLRPANRTLGLFYPADRPERVQVPPAPDIAAVLKDFAGAGEVAAGEAFDPAPRNIESRIVRRTLPSGMKLTLLPKKTRGGTVVARLGLRWGDEQAKANRASACAVASTLLSRGTEKRTRGELKDALDALRASTSVSLDGASIETVRASLPEALAIIAEMLRTPSFPEAEFEQVKRQALTSIDSQRTDPQSLASLTITRQLNPYPPEHWHYTPSLEERAERLKSVTLEEARRCHRELVGAEHADLVVVGDFDPDEVNPVAAFRRPGDRPHDRDPRQGERGVPRRAQPQAPRRPPRLRGARPRQLSPRRLVGRAARAPHPREGRPLVQRRLVAQHRRAGRGRRFRRLRHLRAAEPCAAGSGGPAGDRACARGGVHAGRGRGRASRAAPGAPRRAELRFVARRAARRLQRDRAHPRMGRGVRGQARRAHARRGARRAAAPSRPVEAHPRQGRRLHPRGGQERLTLSRPPGSGPRAPRSPRRRPGS
jgi:zinc protease